MDKKILLVDGNSLLFRAYYANAYGGGALMQTKSGIFTNAIFSFANMLTGLINRGDYYDVKVAFDKGKHTFRHDKLEDYKAGRQKTPEELVQQFPIARELLEAANIPFYEMDNIEADDLIGSMARTIYEQNDDVRIDILTSDKDMYQLINDRTFVMNPKSGTSILMEIGEAELFEKWNCKPNQVADLKGLMGDPSDNLKGVPGVGEKTAIKLITEYGNIESIYDHIEEIKGALKNKLIDGKDSAILCKDIATIRTQFHIDNLSVRKLNLTIDPLVEFLKKYEMFSLVNRFATSAEQINKEEKINFKVIDAWSKDYETDDNYVIVESLDTNYHNGKIIGISISNEKGNFYLNFASAKQLDIFSFDDETDLNYDEGLKEFFESNLKKNTYDIKRTVKLLENAGYSVDYDSFIYDMMSACYVINPSTSSTFANHLRMTTTELNIDDDEVFYGKGTKQNPDIELNKKAEFIVKKALYLKDTKENILNIIKEEDQLVLYNEIDFKLIKVLKSMEDHGVLIDRKELEKQTESARTKILQIERDVKDMVGDLIPFNFNLSSPKQVKELLYDKLSLPDLAKGSTSKETLEMLLPYHAIISYILDYRKWTKLYSTYLSGFEKYIHEDNKVYTIYNQNLTATGRLSSQEPNLQNISVRDEDQKEVRKIFVIDKDYEWFSYDYSQIELRVMAQMADEKHMLDIFNEDGDIHKASAMKIFNLSNPDDVKDDMRRVAKVFNFGIIYGLSDYGLSKDLNISVKEAKAFIDKYYESFPGIAEFKTKTIEFCQENGYVETLTNRRRFVPEVASKMYMQRQAGERIAVNMPIQGTAADILKIAMINIFEQFESLKLKSYMSSQIHDEIIFAIEKSEIDQAKKIIKSEMSQAFEKLRIMFNLKEDIKVKLTESESEGNNWFELK